MSHLIHAAPFLKRPLPGETEEAADNSGATGDGWR